MKRTLVILTVLVLAVLLFAIPGLVAAKGNPHLSLYGTINSYDCDAGEITIITTGNGGDEIDVELNVDTLYKQCTEEGPGSSNQIECKNLVVGYEVRIIRDRETLVATRVIQYVPVEE